MVAKNLIEGEVIINCAPVFVVDGAFAYLGYQTKLQPYSLMHLYILDL
jgi:hypothetical protein